MTRVSPFTAYRYNTGKVSLRDVVCPPYDVINKKQRASYIRSSTYNVVRLVLPENRDGSRNCKKARKDLCNWIGKGILKKETRPAIYIYQQQYKIDNKPQSRMGVISLLKLQRDKTSVLPHEKIFSRPFMDRVRLMKETRAHLSPIFLVFGDKSARILHLINSAVKFTRLEADINFEGIRHKLWKITDKDLVDKISKIVGNSTLFIADGHHRHAASMAVKDYFARARKSANGSGYTLAYFVSSSDKGLKILPTHRAVSLLPEGFSEDYIKKRLSQYFDISAVASKDIYKLLKRADTRKRCGFIFYFGKKFLYLQLKDKNTVKNIGPKDASFTWKSLDVSILHNLIFKRLGIRENIGKRRNIYYYKDSHELFEKLRSGEHKLGVLLNAPGMDKVEEIAMHGEKMPHKSTYFYPKPLTGLVIHKF